MESFRSYIIIVSITVYSTPLLLTFNVACNRPGEVKIVNPLDSTLTNCHSEKYISVQELYNLCQIPGTCGHQMECEGKIALVKGKIDYGNVFDKQHYPQLPYEKFLIRDHKLHKPIEVWTIAVDNKPIFEAVWKNQSSPENIVLITGKLVGFDMPDMDECHRSIQIEIGNAESIIFQK